MNFKKPAEKLEQFLKEELQNKLPLVLLSNGSLVLEKFVIKQTKDNSWSLARIKGDCLDKFNTRSSAIMAAKLYSSNNFVKYSEIKILDQFYYKHQIDSEIFKLRHKTTKDLEKKDLYLARFLEAKQNADYAKSQIASRFKMMF